MTHRPSEARRSVIPYLALLLVLVVGVGGGYALAASKTKTITVCADKKTGVLHLKVHGRCRSSQTQVTWNQHGPQGPQGPQGANGAPGPQGPAGGHGPTGAQGSSAVSVWANVADDGTVLDGRGIAVQHVSGGPYQVTITDPTMCSRRPTLRSSPCRTPPSDRSHRRRIPRRVVRRHRRQPAVSWCSPAWWSAGPSATFTASDHTFDVLDTCR